MLASFMIVPLRCLPHLDVVPPVLFLIRSSLQLMPAGVEKHLSLQPQSFPPPPSGPPRKASLNGLMRPALPDDALLSLTPLFVGLTSSPVMLVPRTSFLAVRGIWYVTGTWVRFA